MRLVFPPKSILAGQVTHDMTDPPHGANPDLNQPAAGRSLPAEEVFLETGGAGIPAGAAAPSLAVSLRPPGPGLWESIAWMVGVHIVQLAASAAAVVVIAGAFLATTGASALETSLATQAGLTALTNSMRVYFTANLMPLIGAAQLATIAFG